MNEEMKLSRSANHVQKYISSKGFSFEVLELPDSTRSAQDAASTIGCLVEQIIKSLLFKCTTDNQPVLVLASGANRVNEKIIAALLGHKIVKADANFTRKTTGYAIGGVPPVAHKTTVKHIFIDEDLMKHEILWAAAGTPNAVFSLPSKELEPLTDGKLVAIK